jgi:potassium-transporting ATPase KdpC subunit
MSVDQGEHRPRQVRGLRARQFIAELRSSVLVTASLLLVCGVVYPVVLFGIARIAFPRQASGSLLHDAAGRIVGSALIGQTFVRPEYFHGRPSVTGYDAANSSGSNIGPTNPQLLQGNDTERSVSADDTPPPNAVAVEGKPHTYLIAGSYGGARRYAQQFRAENGLAESVSLPVDAVTASGSGLDPHISPANAALQLSRVARARAASIAAVLALVSAHTEGRQLGVLGEPRVNVLLLNLALDSALPSAGKPRAPQPSSGHHP